MEPIYQQSFYINDNAVDCFGRLKPSMILYYAQEVAGRHFDLISMDPDAMNRRHVFWAIIRQRVQVTRLPMLGETIRVETWPMPTTRVAYPRSVVAYDENGHEVFRSISLWVIMDAESRSMILPGRTGITVEGTLRGNELTVPGSLAPRVLKNSRRRQVAFTDLDRNGHMNNTRYLDWIDDLLPGTFHRSHSYREFTVCYLAETFEGQELTIYWDLLEEGCLQVDAYRDGYGSQERVFSARIHL